MEILGAKKEGGYIRVPVDKAAEVMGMNKDEAQSVLQEMEAEALYPEWDERTGEMEKSRYQF